MKKNTNQKRFTKGRIEAIETYRGYNITLEHDLNIYQKIKDEDNPIYTICKMGRCVQGELTYVKSYIDEMITKYGDKLK